MFGSLINNLFCCNLSTHTCRQKQKRFHFIPKINRYYGRNNTIMYIDITEIINLTRHTYRFQYVVELHSFNEALE